jgi:hypothetical protein
MPCVSTNGSCDQAADFEWKRFPAVDDVVQM